MSRVKVEKNPDSSRLDQLGVDDWPIWTKEESEFPWSYDECETCFLLEGEVEVTTADGETVRFGQGDLVTFPQGLSCTWKITRAVRKHYRFG